MILNFFPNEILARGMEFALLSACTKFSLVTLCPSNLNASLLMASLISSKIVYKIVLTSRDFRETLDQKLLE